LGFFVLMYSQQHYVRHYGKYPSRQALYLKGYEVQMLPCYKQGFSSSKLMICRHSS